MADYLITLAPSGIQYRCDENTSLLDGALKHNLALPHSCRRGDCNECRAFLEDGTAVLTCETKPQTDTVLMLDVIPELQGISAKVLPARVSSLEKRGDIAIVRLRLPPTAAFTYLAGQYINIKFQDPASNTIVERSYSIANAYGDEIELHVARVPQGLFSSYIFEQCQINALLRFEGPFGSCVLRSGERPLLLVGGGTGFAPIKAIIEQLVESRDPRPIKAYWGVRTPEHIYFSIPESWKAHPHLSFSIVVSETTADSAWQGATGYVHQVVLDELNQQDLSTFSCYACGAPPMIDSLRVGLAASGLPSRYFYSDPFVSS